MYHSYCMLPATIALISHHYALRLCQFRPPYTGQCALFSHSLSVEYGGCGRKKKRNWWNYHVHCISLWTPVATICIGVQWRKLLKNNHWIFIWIQVCHCQLFHHVSYNEFSLYQKQYDSFQFHLGFFFLLRITSIVCQKNIWDRRYFLVLNLQSNTLFC